MNRINSSIEKKKKDKNTSKNKDIPNEKISKKNKKQEKKKKNPIVRFFRKLLFILIILVILFGFLFYKQVEKNGGGIKGALCTIFGQSVEDLENLKSINILLLGVSEDINTQLTDTIILCNYNPQNQSASMLSIPRDTFIGKNQSTAKGSDKINALYSKDVQKTVDAVNKITGVDIDYYIVVKTSSLVKIVDIIGGVNFEVPIDMDYDDPTQDLHIHLSQGMQKINGEKAEQLLRFRHNNDNTSYPSEYGDNDYGRMRTQREFIQETIKQTLTIKNLINAPKIINTVFDNIETNLTKKDCIPYIPTVSEFDVNSIVNVQLPGKSEKCNNLWFFLHDKKETKKVVSELFE